MADDLPVVGIVDDIVVFVLVFTVVFIVVFVLVFIVLRRIDPFHGLRTIITTNRVTMTLMNSSNARVSNLQVLDFIVRAGTMREDVRSLSSLLLGFSDDGTDGSGATAMSFIEDKALGSNTRSDVSGMIPA